MRRASKRIRTGVWPMMLMAVAPLAACAAEQPRAPLPPAGIAAPKRIPDPVTPSPPGDPIAIAALPRAIRRAVVDDAARRLGIEAHAVVVTRAERVTWPDGSLGCAQPGRLYTQALVPGYRVVARTAQGELVYHTDMHGNVATCSAATAQSPHETRQRSAPVDPVTRPRPHLPDR